MASYLITLGVGTPAAIPEFLLVGLSMPVEVDVPDPPSYIEVEADGRFIDADTRGRTITADPAGRFIS